MEIDAHGGYGLSFIHRMRRRNMGKNPGGGVSLVFRKSTIGLKEYKIKRKDHEIVCARGKLHNNTRPFFVIGVYISTKYKASQYHECLSLISDAVLKIKTEVKEAYIMI